MIKCSRGLLRPFWLSLAAGLFAAALGVFHAAAQSGGAYFLHGNLVLSRSVYDNNPNNVTVGMILPPNCTGGCVNATVNGSYPYVFNNVIVDASVGVTSQILLDQVTPAGVLVNSLEVSNSSQNLSPSTTDQMATSFSSKSELALNLSTDNTYLTFMGYLAPINAVDVSNSNTPAVVDPTNPVGGSNDRVFHRG